MPTDAYFLIGALFTSSLSDTSGLRMSEFDSELMFSSALIDFSVSSLLLSESEIGFGGD